MLFKLRCPIFQVASCLTMRFLGLKLVYVLLIPYQFLNYTYWQYARQVTCIVVNEKQYLRYFPLGWNSHYEFLSCSM